MTTLSTPYPAFANPGTIQAAEVNANFSAIQSHVNTELVNRDASVAFIGVPLAPATMPTVANHLTRKGYVDQASTTGNAATATLAATATVTARSTDASHFLTFVTASTTASRSLYTDGNMSYNPSTNKLTATGGFVGDLTGNADTATNVDLDLRDWSPTFFQGSAVAVTSNNSCWRRTGDYIEAFLDLVLNGNGTDSNVARVPIPTGAINATYGVHGAVTFVNAATGPTNLFGYITDYDSNEVNFVMAGDTGNYNTGMPTTTRVRGHFSYYLA